MATTVGIIRAIGVRVLSPIYLKSIINLGDIDLDSEIDAETRLKSKIMQELKLKSKIILTD